MYIYIYIMYMHIYIYIHNIICAAESEWMTFPSTCIWVPLVVVVVVVVS